MGLFDLEALERGYVINPPAGIPPWPVPTEASEAATVATRAAAGEKTRSGLGCALALLLGLGIVIAVVVILVLAR